MRATASARSRGDNSETCARLALRFRSRSITRDGGGEERLEPGDVVAHIFDQLRIARGMRAMRLVDQLPSIGGAIEHRPADATARHRLVIAEHALPGRTRMRRLDQGIGQIAKLPFVVGELELRRPQADAAGRLGAEPAMHVVVAKILAGAAEIAAAAAAERQRRSGAASGPVTGSEPAVSSGSENTSPAYRMSAVSADGDGDPGPYPLPDRCLRWFRRVRVRSGPREGSG